jgi:hypothetical protein
MLHLLYVSHLVDSTDPMINLEKKCIEDVKTKIISPNVITKSRAKMVYIKSGNGVWQSFSLYAVIYEVQKWVSPVNTLPSPVCNHPNTVICQKLPVVCKTLENGCRFGIGFSIVCHLQSVVLLLSQANMYTQTESI